MQNKWQWAKILDAGGRNMTEKPTCFAFGGDRIAIAFPQGGVKVWLFIKGPLFYISTWNVVQKTYTALCHRYMAPSTVHITTQREDDQVCGRWRSVDGCDS